MKINRNKNLLILYNLWKKLSKFSIAQKKILHAFSFQLCSTANSKFSFYVASLCETNCIKIQAISLVSKSIYFSRDYRDPFGFIYFQVNIRQRLKKKVQASLLFLQLRSLVQQQILGMLRDLILQILS